MSPKKPVAPISDATFDPVSPETAVLRAPNRLSEQIARLQEQQLALIAQTTKELDSIRQEVEGNQEAEELRHALTKLQQKNAFLEQQLGATQQQLQAKQAEVATNLTGLKNHLRGQAHNLDQQLRVFTLDTTQNLESMLAALDAPTLPPVAPSYIASIASLLPTIFQEEPLPPISQDIVVPPTIEKKPRPPRKRFMKKMAVRLVTLALLGAAGYSGWTTYQKGASTHKETGTVAGVSTAAPQPSQDPYAESYAEIPFGQTIWETISDQDFGLRMDYPKNTTNKVRVVGGSNLWFLRRNGYLMKITKIETPLDLEAWWTANKQNYSDDMMVSQVTFKNQPAWYVTSKSHTATSGSSYFIKHGAVILQFWVKDEAATTDDGQRLNRMVDSIAFLT